ncbi:hypothetical protein [Enterococcus hermanniensis]|uniref:Uncharacterized protein n=1 Tax=Enterococcus hermanniensis TaxID=249189 RepID=A0A1L8TPV1_9ENTE|nr:hypothetical protein [Enterococcus hermanniensis]OJG46300.1 hypothetical protein RV04_GL001466 [Enterococcus hermanniensis]
MNVSQIKIKVSELISGKYSLDRHALSLGPDKVIKLEQRRRKNFSTTRGIQINDQNQTLQQAWYFGAPYEVNTSRKENNQKIKASAIKVNDAREAKLTIEWQIFPTSA